MIVGSEVAVMLLNCCNFIAEPDGNLIDAFSNRNQKTGKRVAHRMRRNPVASLCAHVFHEGRAKVVAIKAFSVGHVGPEHERIARAVRFKKHLKLDGERNRTFFAVFKIDRGCFPKVKSPGIEVEPERTRFDDFLESQTGMEAGKQNEFEFVGRRSSNESVAKLKRAKILASSPNRFCEFHVLDRIATGGSGDFNCPAKKGTHGHDISKRGRVRRADRGRR